jgi:rRNA-processing protein FCF1
MPRRPPEQVVVFDANVLIDYWRGNRSLLPLISTEIATIVIPSVVFDEVHELTDHHCRAHRIQLVELSVEVMTAASGDQGGLSLPDRLCLALAKERGAHCVTNDVPLRNQCELENVPVLWGLEPLVTLVQLELVSPRIAQRTVLKMQKSNPHYITRKIVDDFMKKIEG